MRDLLSDLNKGDDRLRNEFKYVGWDVKLYPHSPTKGGGIHRGKPSPEAGNMKIASKGIHAMSK